MPTLLRRISPLRLVSSMALAALVSAAAMVGATPRTADACGGTPAPPPAFCGRGYAFAKAGPLVFVAGGAVFVPIPTFHFLTLVEGNPASPVCPPGPHTISGTITIGGCLPAGPGAGPIPFGPIVIAPGINFVPLGIAVPAGPPRVCTITVSSSVTFSDGVVIGPLVGDVEICFVDPSPGDPLVPRLDMELLTPEIVGMHAGDQGTATYRLTNNDDVETWTGTLNADFRNTAKQPGESPPPAPVRLAMALADPGPGDNWPIRFAQNIPPGGCIPLPPAPQFEILSEDTLDPIVLLPGESIDLEVVARPWGMCADGSCGESTVVADGTFSDSTTGIACAGAAYYVDNTLPPQYLWPDSGATVFVDPFDPWLIMQGSPTPSDFVQLISCVQFPPEILIEELPVPVLPIPDVQSDLGQFAGRTTETLQPPPNAWNVDSFFDIDYRIEFQPGPDTPTIQTEMLAMDLVGGAPFGFENVAPMGMGLAANDHDGDFQVDSFFDVFYQISGYADLSDGNTAPIQIVGLDFFPSGNGFDVHLVGTIGPGTAHVVQAQLLNDLRAYARTVPPPLCPADLDGDDDVDVFDFGIFISNFGSVVPPFTNGDLDGDGIVTVFDFGLFAAQFGCPN